MRFWEASIYIYSSKASDIRNVVNQTLRDAMPHYFKKIGSMWYLYLISQMFVVFWCYGWNQQDEKKDWPINWEQIKVCKLHV